MSASEFRLSGATLSEVREKLRAMKFAPNVAVTETIESDGLPKTITASATTFEAAMSECLRRLPSKCTVTERSEVSKPSENIHTITAFDDKQADMQARQFLGVNSKLVSIVRVQTGSRGLLGFRARPNQYEARVVHLAVAFITFTTEARIAVRIEAMRDVITIPISEYGVYLPRIARAVGAINSDGFVNVEAIYTNLFANCASCQAPLSNDSLRSLYLVSQHSAIGGAGAILLNASPASRALMSGRCAECGGDKLLITLLGRANRDPI